MDCSASKIFRLSFRQTGHSAENVVGRDCSKRVAIVFILVIDIVVLSSLGL